MDSLHSSGIESTMTIASSLPHGHIVAIAPPVWGHVKPLCALLTKVVCLRHIYVTMFITTTYFDKVNNKVARQFLPEGEEDLKSLIRVIALPASPYMTDIELFRKESFKGYKTLFARKPIAAAPDDKHVYDAVEVPQLVVLDFFMYDTITDIHNSTGEWIDPIPSLTGIQS